MVNGEPTNHILSCVAHVLLIAAKIVWCGETGVFLLRITNICLDLIIFSLCHIKTVKKSCKLHHSRDGWTVFSFLLMDSVLSGIQTSSYHQTMMSCKRVYVCI